MRVRVCVCVYLPEKIWRKEADKQQVYQIKLQQSCTSLYLAVETVVFHETDSLVLVIVYFCICNKSVFRSPPTGQKPVGFQLLPCHECRSGPLADSFRPSRQSFLRSVAPWDSSIHRLLDHSGRLEPLHSHRRSTNWSQCCVFLRWFGLHPYLKHTSLQILAPMDLTPSAWSPSMTSSAELRGHCLPVCSTEVCYRFFPKGPWFEMYLNKKKKQQEQKKPNKTSSLKQFNICQLWWRQSKWSWRAWPRRQWQWAGCGKRSPGPSAWTGTKWGWGEAQRWKVGLNQFYKKHAKVNQIKIH